MDGLVQNNDSKVVDCLSESIVCLRKIKKEITLAQHQASRSRSPIVRLPGTQWLAHGQSSHYGCVLAWRSIDGLLFVDVK